MRYTISEKADRKIDEDMRIIVKEIRKRIPSTKSIILTGGFSRGEGPVKEIQGKFFPYNDYDIQVISGEKLSKKEIDDISVDISKILGYKGIVNFYPFKKEEQKLRNNFYIDMKVDSEKDLKGFLPRIRNYELRNNSVILWGKDFRKNIPEFSLEEVPLGEGAKLLIDRMSQMIEYYSTEGKYDDEFLSYIIQQAYAACSTSLLLLNKKYQIGYKNTMEILKKNYQSDFPELYNKIPDLVKKIEVYVNWKSNPIKLPYKDVKREWFIAKNNILEVSKYFFSRFLNKKIKNNEELARSMLYMEKEFYLPFLNSMIKNKININPGNLSAVFIPLLKIIFKYKYYKRLKEVENFKFTKIYFSKSPDLVISSSVVYIISSINEGGVDKNLYMKGKKLLNQVYPCKCKDWESLSLDYANAYIAFFMQKL